MIVEEKSYVRGSKHDNIIKCLEKRLKDSSINYDFIKHNVVYSSNAKDIGECDLWARYVSTKTWKVYDLFFEIKTSDKNLYSAMVQLKKDKIYLSNKNVDVVHKFYVNENKLFKIKF